MRLMLSQINPTIGDFIGNTAKILKGIEAARQAQVHLVVFPELAICGYPPGDLLLLPDFIDCGLKVLDEIVAASKDLAVIVGLPRYNFGDKEKRLYNSAAVINNCELQGFQDKTLLPTYDVFDERRYFEPATEFTLWKIAGCEVAVTICEDIWQHSSQLKETLYRRDPILELGPLGADLIVNLSASPYSPLKAKHRLEVCQKAAKTLSIPVALCNQVGGNDSLIFDGHSLYCDAKGELLAWGLGFCEDRVLIDTDALKTPLPLSSSPSHELYEALVLGVKDYFKKSGFQKACLGLSGGIDSAVVACIAVEALGPQNILGVSMPSRYSSLGSIVDAEKLAKNLKIAHKTLSIESPFNAFLDLLEPEFVGHKVDVTEENLQARIRGMIIMALSNKFGYIALNTGNKSELGVGYCTLYGDMCGGLSVLGDVFKTQVYTIAQWINRQKQIIPQATLYKPPSAELSPDQKDSDSLPDYQVLDNILQAYIEKHLPALEIAKMWDYPLFVVEDIIKRVHKNEYKRRQAPLALRVSDKAFSVGREFPVVQRFVF